MENDNRLKMVKFASYASISFAVIILLLKIYGYFQTHSSSLFASLSDSMADVLMSCSNLFAAIYAMKPADKEHRFGHGKAEDLAVLLQSIILFIVSSFIIYNAINSIYNEKTVNDREIGIYVMIASSVLLFVLIAIQSYVVKKTNSKIVHIDKMHYLTDLLMNVAVIIAIYFAGIIDSIVAVIIAIYIMFSVSRILINSFNNLMDHEFSDDEKKKVTKILRNNSKILGFHDLKTRISGPNYFIQVHLEFNGNMVLNDCHKITEKIESQIKSEFDNCEVIIHQDPAGADEEVQFEDID